MKPEHIILIGTLIPTIAYFSVAAAFLYQGLPWNALVWGAYSAANIGLMKIQGIF